MELPINLIGGRSYHIHTVSHDDALAAVKLSAQKQGARFVPLASFVGNRENVNELRALLLVALDAPTIFFVASQKTYTHDAQALLLKVLEELPATSTVVFYTVAPNDLLDTIRSRTVNITLAPQVQKGSLANDALLFLQTKPEKRLLATDKYVVADDDGEAHALDTLVKNIEAYIALQGAAINNDTLLQYKQTLFLFHDARRLRTIPPKQLFEYLAVSLPDV